MFIINRHGDKESVHFDNITERINKLLKTGDDIDPIYITQKIVARLYTGIKTSELDDLASQICMSLITNNPKYGELASRIVVSNSHKNTSDCFTNVIEMLYDNTDIMGEHSPLVSKEVLDISLKYKDDFDKIIDYSRDYLLDFFAFKTLEKAYLLKLGQNQIPIERPQHLFMRVAIGIHGDNMPNIIKTYNLLSQKYFTHATPTLFHAGTNHPQMSSCFLSSIDDSVEGIFETIGNLAQISKWAGGIGLTISNIRSKGAYIKKTGGRSDGIMPLLKTLNSVACYINQSGKRNGSFAIYIEPWHSDILTFLDAKKNHGAEETRARDLFYALWIPDLFMKRVKLDGVWTLFCPGLNPLLSTTYGDEFEKLYIQYELEPRRINKVVKARDIWSAIISSQIETGTPYMLYKDACNKKSNQKNIGVIRSSNLCVSGDTMILTSEGYYPIIELVGKDIKVWNGEQWSVTTPYQTGVDQKLINVEFSNGLSLKCTPYHKFYIENLYQPVEAKDLKTGMHIENFNIGIVSDSGLIMSEKEMMDVNFVPINHSTASKIKWLEHYTNSIGFIESLNYSTHLSFTSATYKFLINMLYMLQTLGVMSKIRKNETLPGGFEYHTLYINSNDVIMLKSLGFKATIIEKINESKFKPVIIIKAISDEGEIGDTFCFTEPKKNKGVFNGILTGNCAEIVQYSSTTETAVCNLASICLPRFLEETINDNYMNTSEAIAIKDQILKYTKSSKLYVYTKPDCVYCKLIKDLFKRLNISYTEIGKSEVESIYSGVLASTVPQVLAVEISKIDGFPHTVTPLGGYTEAWNILKPKINYTTLAEIAGVLVENLNNIIDRNFYPIEKCRKSNNTHRPIGLGVQGLADLFIKLRIPFESDEASLVNKKIFETIYYGAVKSSMNIAIRDGEYETFRGSPMSNGQFQFNLWGLEDENLSGLWDWKELRRNVINHGVRNSLLTAIMPTASTSQIMSNNECIEPYTSNVYTRRTIAGEFTVINNHLLNDLITMDLWNDDIKDRLIFDRGSVQKIKGLPVLFKNIYKTVWEVKQKKCIELAAERAPFICQSQSLNLWFESPSYNTLTSAHFLGWEMGLKTGSYYIRSKPATNPQRFGLDVAKEKAMAKEDEECVMCSA